MKIAEVSKRYGLSADTLRYYERAGLLRHVPRDANGIRNYDETACKTVEFVKCMRDAGVSVEALVRYMELFDEGDSTIQARIDLLKEQRDAIAEKIAGLQAGLDRLDYKIAHYNDIIRPRERELLSGEGEKAR